MAWYVGTASDAPGECPSPDEDVARVPIRELRAADSPRLDGVDHDHMRTLAEIEEPLPPILVHRETMCVIDGMHRLRAAQIRGCDQIDVRFVSGTLDEAFLLAVKANVAHGLPLTLNDRQSAAERIICANSALSDRSIAAIAGLAAKTVAVIRSRTPNASGHTRLGRDGRVRPLSTVEGRLIASRAIADRPDSSLREIATQAGISVGTVRDVRARLRAGKDPVPQRERRDDDGIAHLAGDESKRSGNQVDIESILDGLRRDPSLRYSESGRVLLRWLVASGMAATRWRDGIASVPPHCAALVEQIAREYAKSWMAFAHELERRND